MRTRISYCSVAVTLLLIGSLGACGSGVPIFECDHELLTSVESEDSKFKAATLLVQCGATTADATWVLLTPAVREYDPDADKVAIFEGRGIEIAWQSGALNVAYENAKPFRSDAVAYGIRINYINKDDGREDEKSSP